MYFENRGGGKIIHSWLTDIYFFFFCCYLMSKIKILIIAQRLMKLYTKNFTIFNRVIQRYPVFFFFQKRLKIYLPLFDKFFCSFFQRSGGKKKLKIRPNFREFFFRTRRKQGSMVGTRKKMTPWGGSIFGKNQNISWCCPGKKKSNPLCYHPS